MAGQPGFFDADERLRHCRPPVTPWSGCRRWSTSRPSGPNWRPRWLARIAAAADDSVQHRSDLRVLVLQTSTRFPTTRPSISCATTEASGSGRRRPRGVRFCRAFGDRHPAGRRCWREASLGRGGLPGVGSTEVHVQLRLLIGDVSAGHSGDLFWGVESPAIPARLTESQAGPAQGTVPTPGPAYGRVTPNLRPTSASSIQIDARIHPVCRRALCSATIRVKVRVNQDDR